MSNNSNKNIRTTIIIIVLWVIILIAGGYLVYDEVVYKNKDILTIIPLLLMLPVGAGIYFLVKKEVPLVVIKGIVIAICAVLIFVGEFFGF